VGCRDASLRVKLPGREADHSPPSSAEVKMCGAIPSLPQYALMVWFSVKARWQLYLCIMYKKWTHKREIRPFASFTSSSPQRTWMKFGTEVQSRGRWANLILVLIGLTLPTVIHIHQASLYTDFLLKKALHTKETGTRYKIHISLKSTTFQNGGYVTKYDANSEFRIAICFPTIQNTICNKCINPQRKSWKMC